MAFVRDFGDGLVIQGQLVAAGFVLFGSQWEGAIAVLEMKTTRMFWTMA